MTQCFGLTDRGRVRPNNEDYFRLAPEFGLAVLADGMGGANAGERASQLAADTVIEAIVSANGHRDAAALQEAFLQANTAVLALAKTDRKLEGMGTTIVAALDEGDEISIASVGDSRAYLWEDSALRPVTSDQSWINEVGRVMGMDEETLKYHPMRHVLTMAIGASPRLIVNAYRKAWSPGSVLLLSSDGLHGVVPNEKIEELLSAGAGQSLEDNCRRLVDAALAAGAPDNVTVVLMRRDA